MNTEYDEGLCMTIWDLCEWAKDNNAFDLVDGRYVDELNDVKFPYRGSTNQRLIDVRKSINTGKAVLYEL